MTDKKPRPYKHPQINLRIPEDLKIKIQELADENSRSMNSEIIDRLEKSLSPVATLQHEDILNLKKCIIEMEYFLKNK